METKNKTNSLEKETALDYFAAHLTDPQIQSALDRLSAEQRNRTVDANFCRRTKNNPVLLGDRALAKLQLWKA